MGGGVVGGKGTSYDEVPAGGRQLLMTSLPPLTYISANTASDMGGAGCKHHACGE